MHGTPVGPIEDLDVGQGITVTTPKGDVTILVEDTGDGDEVKFHLDGPSAALALVDADAGLTTDATASEKEAA